MPRRLSRWTALLAAVLVAPAALAQTPLAVDADRDLARLWVLARAALDSTAAPAASGAQPADSALVAWAAEVGAFVRADPVLSGGGLGWVAGAGRAFAAERTWGGERRVVAVNLGDAPAFVALPGAGVPDPLVPVLVSRADAGRVPSLVALFDDDRAVYGLRVPARCAVVYRPAGPGDVRPRGLDE